eukprot:247109-Amphidinium_carterae.1
MRAYEIVSHKPLRVGHLLVPCVLPDGGSSAGTLWAERLPGLRASIHVAFWPRIWRQCPCHLGCWRLRCGEAACGIGLDVRQCEMAE